MKINIFSLPTVIAINWLILIFVIFFPSNIYQDIIDEHYFAHLNGEIFVYITLALGFMWLGWEIITLSSKKYEPNLFIPPVEFIWLLRCIGLFIPFIYTYRLIFNAEVQAALSSNMPMNDIRDIISSLSINYLIQLGIITNIICFYFHDIKTQNSKLNYIIFIIIALVLFMTMQRSLLMPYILAIFVAYYHGNKKMTLLKALTIAGIVLISSLMIFVLIAALREQTDVSLIQSMIGYTITSYNRLALILNGDLILPDSQTGYYTLQWLYYPPVIRDFLEITSAISNSLGIPLPETRLENYFAQFDAIDKTPLVSSFIWTTFFGVVYSDYAWYSLIFYFLFGLLCKVAYISMQRKQLIGIFLYSYIYATSLLWFGDGFIFHSTTLLMCYIAILLQFIMYFFLLKKNSLHPLGISKC